MLKYHIQTIDLSSDQSTISFNNIPQDFSDLVITISGRTNRTAGFEDAQILLNGSSSNFTGRRLGGQGTGSPSVYTDSFSVNYIGQMDTDFATANTFGNLTAYIYDYTAPINKSFSIDFVTENNAGQAFQEIRSLVWANTAPITSFALGTTFGTNFKAGTSVSLYGVRRGDSKEIPTATGGTVSTSGGYTIHTFTESGTFVANRGLEAEYLVIAGAGGGGGGGSTYASGGGGGAGGYRSSVVGESSGGGASAESKLTLAAGSTHVVTVGAGGAGGAANYANARGSSGSNSVFSTITSTGGGGAEGWAGGLSLSGGSGAGGGGYNSNAGDNLAGSGTANQGFAGGRGGSTGNGGTAATAGGGGGAGSVGSDGANIVEGSSGVTGGSGVSSSITGTSVARAGGGGGGSNGGAGGTAVAGAGAAGNGNSSGTAGTPNTGGGGGGASGGVSGGGTAGGNGGSGVVIIRYLTP